MTDSAPVRFPFSAVVGQDHLRLALILSAIAPRIGGVVIRGEKGTAKTTTVRAFAALMGDAPLVNLPIGATEDRVIGSLNVETVLTTGHAEYQPGLLAEADGGVLYVDEVNLLADNLVDALLDAAATGQVTIERDGISHFQSTRFVLVGTMNPEEGELRPQLLDRFGLAVDVTASREVDVRTAIIRRRLAFEADPGAFAERYAAADAEVAQRIRAARERLAAIDLPDDAIARIAGVCAAFDVDGMRADLVIARAATAHAAWRGANRVEEEDIRVAAELALPHRKRRDPFDEPGLNEQELNDALDQAPQLEDPDKEPQPSSEDEPQDSAPQPPNTDADQDAPQQPNRGTEGSADQGAPFRP